MTIVVTRNVKARTRGFLASVSLEIAPGVYISPKMNAGVRNRVWSVLSEWWSGSDTEGMVMVWREPSQPGGLRIKVLGSPPTDLFDQDGVFLARREVTQKQLQDLVAKHRIAVDEEKKRDEPPKTPKTS